MIGHNNDLAKFGFTKTVCKYYFNEFISCIKLIYCAKRLCAYAKPM